jgi:lipopolysaccharide export system protein LptC
VDSDTVVSTLDVTRIETDSAVAGTAPFGDLQAGALLIEKTRGESEDQSGGKYVLLFTGGVDLLYDPKQHRGDKR